ncbi:MAG: ArnT family glycosyltransferase [Thermoguttaceae bacterium]
MVDRTCSPADLRLLALAAVLIAVAVFLCPLLLPVPLVDPDEGLHAAIAQEMVERGDWITPRFQGEAFLDKPILFTWAQALSLRALGMNASAARLPGLLFGLAAMAATGVIGWRIYGRAAGLIAAMLYGTMILPSILAQVPVHDAALIPLASLAILLFWEADRAQGFRPKAVLTAAIGVLLGLTCLTKGLVGVGLVGVAYGSWLLVTRRLTVEACVRGAAALAIAGLVALPWYLAMEARLPGYLHYYFVERHVMGLATDTQRHSGKPAWYYLPIVLGGAMPWTVYLPVAVGDWRARRRQEAQSSGSGGTALLWCWLAACTLLLSVAGSKLVTYIWPVFPPIAVLAASVWAQVLEGSLSERAKVWFGRNFAPAGWIGPLLLPPALFGLHLALGVPVPWYVAVLAVAVGFSAWLPSWLWCRGRYGEALPVGALVPAAHILFLMAFVAPHACEQFTARDLAMFLNRRGAVPEQMVIVEERVGSVIFYLEPALRARLRPGQIRGERAREVEELEDAQPGTVYALAESRMEEASRDLDLDDASWQPAGRYRLYGGESPACRACGAAAGAGGLSMGGTQQVRMQL